MAIIIRHPALIHRCFDSIVVDLRLEKISEFLVSLLICFMTSQFENKKLFMELTKIIIVVIFEIKNITFDLLYSNRVV